MQEIFGKGNFFLEIQDQGLEEEHRINPLLIRLSAETGIPLVATNDVHYVRREDAEAHDVLLAIQTGTTLDDDKRMRFPNDEFYLKSEDEMRSIFTYAPQAVDNTELIAGRCSVKFTFGEYHLPQFIPPEGTPARNICAICARRASRPDTPRSRLRSATAWNTNFRSSNPWDTSNTI